jgi:hypothetical protein
MEMDHIKTALAIFAWFGALLGPIIVAILCWRWSRWVQRVWLVHLIFTVAILVCEWLFADLLFWASGDSGDGPPGLGLILLPCLGSMLLSIVIYFGCVVAVSLHKRRRRV